MFSSSMRSTERLGSDWPSGAWESGRSSSLQGAMRRATASAWATPTTSGTARDGLRSLKTTSMVPWSVRAPGRISRRTVVGEVSGPQEVMRRTTLTPAVPSEEPRRVPAGRATPSTTSRACGQGVMASRTWNGGRVVTSSPSRSASSTGSVVTMRAPPRASLTCVDRACGSHLTHSHWLRCSWAHSTATRSRAGDTKVARWQTMARTWARAASGSPHTSTRPNSLSMTPQGTSSRLEWVARNRLMAEWQTTSGLARAGSSGFTSSMDSSWEEEPMRTLRRSGALASRSHSRLPSWAMSTRASGSGRYQLVKARWREATSRTVSRTCASWPRYSRRRLPTVRWWVLTCR